MTLVTPIAANAMLRNSATGTTIWTMAGPHRKRVANRT
jgi:hypothetical protein